MRLSVLLTGRKGGKGEMSEWWGYGRLQRRLGGYDIRLNKTMICHTELWWGCHPKSQSISLFFILKEWQWSWWLFWLWAAQITTDGTKHKSSLYSAQQWNLTQIDTAHRFISTKAKVKLEIKETDAVNACLPGVDLGLRPFAGDIAPRLVQVHCPLGPLCRSACKCRFKQVKVQFSV